MTRRSAAPTYLREAALTYRAVRGAPRDLFPDKPITSSADVDRLLRPMLAGRITESLVVLALTGRHAVIGLHEVARGAVNHVHCAPCDLFRYPLMAGAVSLILAHNHPSGDASPSPEDLALTKRCVRLGFELGLSVLDHVIVVQEGYFSLLDAGLLRTGIEDGGAQST
jgi:DNA repair protein RadC